MNLSHDRIARLEKIGFKCKLIAFKEESDFGHCNAPQQYPADSSLVRWCKSIRATSNKIQKGMQTNLILSQDRIDRLEDIRFRWEELSCADARNAATYL